MFKQQYEGFVLIIKPNNKIISRIPCTTLERCYELAKFEIPLKYHMLITEQEFERRLKEFNYTNITYFRDERSGYRIGLIRLIC
jgi:hypothetical protein